MQDFRTPARGMESASCEISGWRSGKRERGEGMRGEATPWRIGERILLLVAGMIGKHWLQGIRTSDSLDQKWMTLHDMRAATEMQQSLVSEAARAQPCQCGEKEIMQLRHRKDQIVE